MSAHDLDRASPTIDLDEDDAEPTLFEKIWDFMDDPASGVGAMWYAAIMMLVIIISVSAMCVETLPSLHKQPDLVTFWFVMELCCIVVFTVDYFLRFTVCPMTKSAFVCEPLNIIDLLAIMPFWIELITTAVNPDGSNDGGSAKVFQVLRVLRLVRVMRVFKMSKYSVGAQVFGRAITASVQPLSMMVFFIFIAMVLFSSGIYYAEKGVWDPDLRKHISSTGVRKGEPSYFQSIPSSFWWCIVTMTTLGYGDTYPTTTAGKLIGAVTAVAGVVVLALPISVIGASFQTEFNRVVRQQEMMSYMQQADLNQKDRDHDGKVSPGESLLFEIEHTLRIHQRDLSGHMSELLDANKTDVFAALSDIINSKRRQKRRR